MTIDSLPAVITLLIALSVATERVVEIIKNLVPQLDCEATDPKAEGRRRAALHALAAVAGIAIALLSWPIFSDAIPHMKEPDSESKVTTVLAIGLLASGGSGFWNSILTIVLNLKQLKAVEVSEKKADTLNVVPQPGEGRLQA